MQNLATPPFHWIDTHCHLDYFDEPAEVLYQKAFDQDVKTLISISVLGEKMPQVFAIAQKISQVYATLGVHPHEAKTWNKKDEQFILQNYLHPKIVGLGELGLDYHYMHSTKEEQHAVFRKQLELSCTLKLPVVIHTREAEDDTIAIMQDFAHDLPGAVLHSFSSKPYLAEFALKHNFFLGFNGMITFPKAENVRDIVKMCPIDKLVLETDSPFLAPIPHRGKTNHSHFLPLVAQKMAELKNVDLLTLSRTLFHNTLSLFPKITSTLY